MEKGVLPGGAVSGRWEAAVVVQGVLGEEQSRGGWVGGWASPGGGGGWASPGMGPKGHLGTRQEGGSQGAWRGLRRDRGAPNGAGDAPGHGLVLPDGLAAPGPRAQGLIRIRAATSPAPLPGRTHARAAPAAEPDRGQRPARPTPPRGQHPQGQHPQGTHWLRGCPGRTPATRPCCAPSPGERCPTPASRTPLPAPERRQEPAGPRLPRPVRWRQLRISPGRKRRQR